MRFIAGLTLLFLLAGCATQPQQYSNDSATDFQVIDEADTNDLSIMMAQQRALDRLRARSSDDDDEVETNDPAFETGAKFGKPEYQMDTKSNLPKVKKWIQYYSKKDRKRFQRFLNRGAKYKQIVQDLLVANDLPPDLYYLGILESGYVTKAVSHAGAVGPWQFMAPTGRQYGLKINNYVDERVDVVRATLAAIRYLKELYRQKKSWYMALAAYNAGPGRVRRAVRRGGTKNYWKLTQRRLLPYDTREYIPQFLAILSIGTNIEKYGFEEKAQEVLEPMELVKVPASVPLKKVSEFSRVPLDQIKKLNPHIRKQWVPPTKSKVYHLWIRKHESALLKNQFANLQKHKVKGLKIQRYYASGYRKVHRVRRGQNLSTIARRYGTSVSKIKRINRLRSNRIYVGQKLRVKGRTGKARKTASIHKVRRGQNLTTIARRYGTSVAKIKQMNNLRSGRIYVGQKLRLNENKTSGSRKVASTHKVRSGQNLTSIARRYGTSVSKLKRMNNLSSGRIYVGQKLKLNGSATKNVKRYKIRRGDNLSSIARRFGTTIRRLKSINKLRSNRIQRGQVLLIASN